MNRPAATSFVSGRNALLLLLLMGSLLFSSCKSRRKIVLNNGKCILDFKNAKTLTNNLKLNEFKLDKLNAKLTVEALIDSTSNSFSISLRMKKDSIIWMSISKLGIEGARVLITKDSVKFVNRLTKEYFKGNFAYLSKLLNTELDFEVLQSLLIGNSVTFYDEDEKIKPGIDNCMYTLGTIRKKKLHRVMVKGKELRDPAQSIYLSPESFKIQRIIFYDFNPDRSFDAVFGEFAIVENQQFPHRMNYTIKAQKNVSMDIIYTKVALNEEQSFPFKIPDDSEQIVYKEN